jgi:predicted amidohydrolase YtcJ
MNPRSTDAVFYNARIYTFDSGRRTVRGMAVEDGRIAAVGDDDEIRKRAPRGCDKFDLGGKPVVPGFIDCHTHFIQMGVDFANVDLSSTRTIEEAMAMMSAAARKAPHGDWVIGTSWKESGWREARFITRKDLDVSCPDNPAVAHRVCGHLSSVNSKAIAVLGIDSDTPEVEFDGSGCLTGILRESAVGIPREATAPDAERKAKGLARAIRKAYSLGVTSINDNAASGDLETYRTAERTGKLGVRVWYNVPSGNLDALLDLSLSTGFGSEWLKIGGLKVFCDGALGARTAAISESYSDNPGNKGVLVHGYAELSDLLGKANEGGLQLAVHAIGDVGIDTALSSIVSVLRKHPRNDHRHRIEHLELPSIAHLRVMRKNKILASMQPNFIGEWGGTDGMYLARLGSKRVVRNNPFREVLDSGVKLVFGSDCMPFDPLYGIHSAVNAPHPSQRLSVEEALAAYTREAAFASFEERLKGTLSVGKFADFAVLSADPFEHSDAIASIKVTKTVLAGKIVFNRPEPRK